MTRLRWLLALPALILATSGPAPAADLRDKAKLFTPEAIVKAGDEMDRIEKEYQVPIRLETVETLNGENIDDVLRQHARAADAHGLYILIARKEHKTEVGESRSFSKYLTRQRTLAIREAINGEFKKGNFDAGLLAGLAKTDSVLSEARAEAGGTLRPTTPNAPVGRRANPAPVPAPHGGPPVPGRPSTSGGLMTLVTIVLGILALFVVIRLLGALFSGGNRGGYAGQQRSMGPGGPGYGPGYGGPGYGGGGGGGGFMSSMFGGIGGALAGNWLYDQFSGRHHDTSVGQSTNYDPGLGATEAPANDDFVTPGDGGGDWGGGGGDDGGGGW